jgi:hypothetical protein
MTKAAANATTLVKAAVAELQARGVSEAEIIADLPRLATAAVAFLAAKAAA